MIIMDAALILDDELGQRDRAQALYARAGALFEPETSPDQPDRYEALLGLGAVSLLQGRAAKAVDVFEQALAALPPDAEPYRWAMIRFWLAKALVAAPSDAGRDLPRARRVATEALEGFRGLGPAGELDAGDVERWLEANPD